MSMNLFRPQEWLSAFWHRVGSECKARAFKVHSSGQIRTTSAAWPRDATNCSLSALADYFGQ